MSVQVVAYLCNTKVNLQGCEHESALLDVTRPLLVPSAGHSGVEGDPWRAVSSSTAHVGSSPVHTTSEPTAGGGGSKSKTRSFAGSSPAFPTKLSFPGKNQCESCVMRTREGAAALFAAVVGG